MPLQSIPGGNRTIDAQERDQSSVGKSTWGEAFLGPSRLFAATERYDPAKRSLMAWSSASAVSSAQEAGSYQRKWSPDQQKIIDGMKKWAWKSSTDLVFSL